MARSMPSPDAAAAKWLRNIGSASESIRDGVMGVTVAPGQAAAAKKDLWLANINAAANRWAENVAKVSLQDWQQAIIGKGIQRIQAGASAAQSKVSAFLSQWLPYQAQVVSSLPPRGTLEQNIQRMEILVRKNHEAKGRFRQSGRAR